MLDDIPPELLAQLGAGLEDEPNDALGRPRNPPPNRPAPRRAMARGRPMVLPGQPQPQQQRQAQPAARQLAFQRPVAMQAGPLAGVVERIEDAIGDENRSRVSQLREMRRMAHEKDIEQIRAQAALERVRQARMVDEWSGGGVLAPGLIDLTGTAKRIG